MWKKENKKEKRKNPNQKTHYRRWSGLSQTHTSVSSPAKRTTTCEWGVQPVATMGIAGNSPWLGPRGQWSPPPPNCERHRQLAEAQITRAVELAPPSRERRRQVAVARTTLAVAPASEFSPLSCVATAQLVVAWTTRAVPIPCSPEFSPSFARRSS